MKSLYSDRPIILDNKAKEIMKKLKPIQVEPKQVKISEMLEEGIKALKEFKPNKMDVKTYNTKFIPQYETAICSIQNLQHTLEGKCDKESLRQLQIIGWNEETKKFISDALNLYNEKVLNELRNISNKSEKKEENNQTLPYGNKWYKEYSEKPTLENSKIGDVILYNDELLINTGAEIIPFTLKKENNMENYIVINGKKTELTEEQLIQLGIKTEKKRNNPFNNKVEFGTKYYYIDSVSGIEKTPFDDDEIDGDFVDVVNSFNDKDFANQLYLHELLSRKLLKYAWDNEAEDYEWNDKSEHYYIYFDYPSNKFIVTSSTRRKIFCVYFSSEKIAKQAIVDVIKPFMKEHPEFVW